MAEGGERYLPATFWDKMAAEWSDAPCNNCQFQKKCHDAELACENYRQWITTGRATDEPKEPSGSVYDLEANKYFSNEDWLTLTAITRRVDVLVEVFEESPAFIERRLKRRKPQRENHAR